jgi:hypothetical protein
MAYTKTPASGLQNIKITPEGSYGVTVRYFYLGAFRCRDKAIKVRDDYRLKNGMPQLTDHLQPTGEP